jgi:hypothetical protein
VYQSLAHVFYSAEDVRSYRGYVVAVRTRKPEARRLIRKLGGTPWEPFVGAPMWILTTSDGRRVADICSEADARRAVHKLGVTQMRGPYSWDVVDGLGHRFVAEVKHKAGSWS